MWPLGELHFLPAVALAAGLTQTLKRNVYREPAGFMVCRQQVPLWNKIHTFLPLGFGFSSMDMWFSDAYVVAGKHNITPLHLCEFIQVPLNAPNQSKSAIMIFSLFGMQLIRTDFLITKIIEKRSASLNQGPELHIIFMNTFINLQNSSWGMNYEKCL